MENRKTKKKSKTESTYTKRKRNKYNTETLSNKTSKVINIHHTLFIELNQRQISKIETKKKR